ncbi:CPCC family cysteine-rich protein [Pragia fontium]|uniref:CPCC family cysteine-rich protein n=1 Tax=Pragia fontium TaxID=82985 RepID=UPI002852ECAB|nr:CPCC family cysteine-rich protein [Pragia fontium]
MMRDELYSCFYCGAKVIDELGCYEVCSVCGWEDGPVQSAEPEYASAVNKVSLN